MSCSSNFSQRKAHIGGFGFGSVWGGGDWAFIA